MNKIVKSKVFLLLDSVGQLPRKIRFRHSVANGRTDISNYRVASILILICLEENI